jgi:hypothetical protein
MYGSFARFIPAAVGAILLALGAAASAQQAFRPTVSINEIMVFIIDHNSHALWDVAADAPDNADDWHLLEHSALAVAASGNLINIGGTGPDDAAWVAEAEWQGYSQAMANAGLAAVEAVRNRNVEALLAAGDQLLNSCLSCHRQYKPELPSVLGQPHMHRP